VTNGVDDSDWQMEFEKLEKDNPILHPLATTPWFCPVRQEEVLWEEKDVFNPAAVVKDGKVHLIYRAEDKVGALAGTSRLGLAISEDGIHFNERRRTPIFYPDHDEYNHFEWEGGCEDPRVIEREDGGYIMTYTSYDGTARLCVASSPDLLTWKKHGPAFGEAFGKAYINAWTKSGSIVVEPLIDGRLVAKKINGTYWMYWGENHIYIATSEDLIHWSPMLGDDKGFYRGRPDHEDLPVYAMKPKSVLRPRKGKFDSNLVEPGPPALLRDDGILFIYNARNTPCPDEPGHVCPKHIADPKLAPGTYSAGQALFSRDDPTKLIARSSDTFFKPTADFEITGQVGNVCFLEGLVYLKRNWYLYYGTADSKIAVAIATKYNYKGNLRHEEVLNTPVEEEIEEGDEMAKRKREELEERAVPREITTVGVETAGLVGDVEEGVEVIQENNREREEERESRERERKKEGSEEKVKEKEKKREKRLREEEEGEGEEDIKASEEETMALEKEFEEM